MALGTIATIVSIAAGAASLANMGYQAAQGAPQGPNLASSSREVAEAQAAALPIQRGLAAAAQQGGTFDVNVPTHKGTQTMVKVPAGMARAPGAGWSSELSELDPIDVGANETIGQIFTGDPGLIFGSEPEFKWVEYKPEEWQEGGRFYAYSQKLADRGKEPVIKDRRTKIKEHTENYDFSGYGTADIEGELARQFSDIQTDLGAKYGVQFAEQRRKEAEMADPEGFAARSKMHDLIQQQIADPMPISPLSGTLNDQIQAQLDARGGIDAMERPLLDQAVAEANRARAGQTTMDEIERSLSTGFEGEARRGAAQDKAANWLESGSTPEDIAYRREQQNLGNLGAFVSGQTPQSQFANLSGAQQGAAPFVQGRPLPELPANAGAAGGPAAVAGYQAQLGQQGTQANNWLAGMSALLQGVGTANQIRR